MPLLLLDEGFMSGALAAVGLRDAGCDVVVLAATGGRGGHVERGVRWTSGPRVDDPRWDDAVADAVARHGCARVVPLTEPTQRRAWARGAAGWGALVSPAPPAAPREALDDKRRMAALAASSGVATPDALDAPEERALHAAVAALGPAVVVKGARGRGGSATVMADGDAAALAAWRRLTSRGVPCFVQRRAAGPTYLVGGLFDDGAPVRLYAGEKLVQHPPRVGPAARIRSVRAPAALVDTVLPVLRALRWTGIASVDVVADGSRFLFLEVNPRPWGSMGAAAAAGVDLFAPWAALLRGEHPTARLAWNADVEHAVMPLWLLSRDARTPRGAMRAIGAGVRGALAHPPGRAMHLVGRLARVARSWPR